MSSGLSADPPSEWNPQRESIEEMEKLVHNSSKGLVELTRSKRSPKVQFIHESVKDYLLNKRGLYEVWPGLKGNPEGLSHSRLSRCCQNALKINLKQYLSQNAQQMNAREDVKQLRGTLDQKFPFLGYAVEHVFYHTDKATQGIAMDTFFTNFDLKSWIQILNSMVYFQTRRYSETASLCYVLADRNAASLIRKLLEQGDAIMPTPQENFRHPLLAAIAHQHWDAVHALLEIHNYPNLAEIIDSLKRQDDISVGKDPSPLIWAIRKGCLPLAEMLLTTSLADINLTNGVGHSPLSLAAFNGFETITARLLSHGATDTTRDPALVRAAQAGHTEIVKMLLSRTPRMDPSLNEPQLSTSLCYASTRGDLEVVKLLLKAGSNVNGSVSTEDLPLLEAARMGYVEVVKMLLAAGADVDAMHHFYGTALRAASRAGEREIVKLLLVAGADIHIRGGVDINAFLAATERGDREIMLLLLNEGACADAWEEILSAALCVASTCGHLDIAKLLLGKGAKADTHASEHGNALRAALNRGHHQIAQLLLEHGARFWPGQIDYSNALRVASAAGQSNMVRILLKRCADQYAQTGARSQALEAASRRGDIEIVKLLLDLVPGTNLQKKSCNPALYAASALGYRELAEILLDAGADVNSDALNLASLNGHVELAELLLSRGANVNLQTEAFDAQKALAGFRQRVRWLKRKIKREVGTSRLASQPSPSPAPSLPEPGQQSSLFRLPGEIWFGSPGHNALYAASLEGHADMIELLLNNGADINALGGYCGTPLLAAATRGHCAIVELLLARGAKVSTEPEMFECAVQIVSLEGYQEIHRLLLQADAKSDNSASRKGKRRSQLTIL